jgi:hypothetical protein
VRDCYGLQDAARGRKKRGGHFYDRGVRGICHLLSAQEKKRIRHDIRRLGASGLATPLEAEIVVQLLDGRRSPAELAQLIYRQSGGNPVPHHQYMRVSRALRNLESRGYVSRNMFGLPKPYKLTRHAMSRLAGAGESHPRGPITRWDVLLYVSTGILTASTAAANMGFLSIARPSFTLLYTSSLLLSGMCATRLIQTVRSVW